MVNNLDRFNAFIKYLKYILIARHRKGAGIHSPAVFEFVHEVMYGIESGKPIQQIKEIICQLEKNTGFITYREYGAGSNIIHGNKRKIGDIVKYTAVEEKIGVLLWKMSRFYKFNTIVELGTSIGASTLYLASGLNNTGSVYSVEANESLLEIAKENASKIGAKNIFFYNNTFEEALSDIIKKIKSPCLAYIDGNHRYEATLDYYKKLSSAIKKGFIIIADIYWSRDMEKAWKYIKKSTVTTIDLYYVGVIVISDLLTPGHYLVRYRV